MIEPNDSQKKIRETLEGMVVVDAGPGTGKTHTIVERYINLIKKPDVSPSDVLLLTFTNNAAAEMDERIKARLSELGMSKDSKLVQTKTFDAFCLSIVLDSPDLVSGFFGFKEKLTRAATLQQNDTLNKEYFRRFIDGFLNYRGADYGDIAIIASEHPFSVMRTIYKLMSKGLIPLEKGWFGNDWHRILTGDTEKIYDTLLSNNTVGSRGGCANKTVLYDIDEENIYNPPGLTPQGNLPLESLQNAADPPREDLFRFIHDVYYAYIKQSVSDNRLTFGLNAMLAFTLLYNHRSVRERNSYRYLMIDEFQDTNANQMMVSLMVLKEPNLCVVGDWKQGIYGFRYVSIENITRFEEKVVEYRRFLNDDPSDPKVRFKAPEAKELPLDVNYRSSQQIIDTAFQCICLKGNSSDPLD